ncbi:MAG: hypothetical protein C3F06_00150 [Candidatus Methanoperedenaceae archaeon]|nr:MAG: hypothetical protein C3F06_00150 [Candidatus Methanoperedenaceae archaeon]
MKNRVWKIIIAIFLFTAISHTTFADTNETYCRSCHGNTVDRHHLLLPSGTYQCTDCHVMKYDTQNQTYYPEVIRNCQTCHALTAHTCMSCHPQVSSSDLGLHSSMNGSSTVDNGDCMTCHYMPFPMVKGAVNNSNTYFCADCHTNAGTGPNKSIRIFNDKKHGRAECMDCHVADGTYHQDNPRGSVANLTYVSRYPTTITNTTDCADCHRAANLDDAPFNAPGGGTHIDNTCTSGGGCHGGNTFVAAVHSTNPLDNLQKKPFISVPTLDYSTVTRGTDVNIAAIANFTNSPPNGNALVDGAQYRINNSDNTQTILPWTPMAASDGNFDSLIEGVTARINTNNLTGTYNIFVRGMGGGPAQNPLERYYPMNGDISPVKSVTLIVQPQGGYINGTIRRSSDNSPLEGVLVSITGASYTTVFDGKYSFSVSPGTYAVTASKQPAYNDITVPGIIVTASNTTYVNITLENKLTGTITGSVTTG